MSKTQTYHVKLSWQISAALFGSMLLVLGVGFFAVLNLYRGLEAKQLEAVRGKSESVVSMVAAQFFERYGDVQAFATNPNIVHPDPQVRIQALNTYIRLYGIYDLIIVTDLLGQTIAVNNQGPTGKAIDHAAIKGNSYHDAEWFLAAIKGEFPKTSPALSGSYFSSVTEDAVSSLAYGEKRNGNIFSAPIFDAAGNKIGVVSTRANAAWIENQFVQVFRVAEGNGELFPKMTWLNSAGEVLGTFHQETIKKDGYQAPAQDLGKESPLAAIAQFKSAQQQKSALQQTDAHNAWFVPLAGEQLPSALGWVLAAEASDTQLLASAKSEIEFLAWTMGGVFCLCGFLAVVFNRRVNKQITLVSQSLKTVNLQNQGLVQKLDSSTNEIAQSVTEQAAAIQESVSALSEINSMVLMTSENAKKATECSTESTQLVLQGRDKMTKMSEAMLTLQNSNKDLQGIMTIINQVYEKTTLIHDIVFKTQLLSFNASIEAARAGQHGRGFAIVAEEVGGLARLSGEAAKEIEALLKDSQNRVGVSLEGIEAKVRDGNMIAQDAVVTFNYLAENVEAIDEQIKGISEATAQQHLGINQTQTAMVQLDASAKKSDEVSHTLIKLIESFKQKMCVMDHSVAKLETMVSGGTSSEMTAKEVVESFQAPEPVTAESTEASRPQLKVVAASEDITADDPSFKSAS
jgi:methyl-accepting chemotaxis protein